MDRDSAVRILCVAGSARRGGNSDRLLDALEHGVSEAGGGPVRITPASAGIAPCRGCNACSATGHCVLRDTMDEIYPLIDSASAIAIATPVYFATVPAVLKALYDRCQPYWARRYVLGEPAPARKRPGALIVVGGGGDPFGASCAVTPTRSVFGVLGVEMVEAYETIGVDSPTDVTRQPDALREAEKIGRDLVRRVLEHQRGT
jgi:multimeric flavodoxin WrbA